MQVILLNGVGSVGKSSTAKALQVLSAEPLLHVAMDDFIAMLPERYFGDPDGLVFEPVDTPEGRVMRTQVGPVLRRVLDGMRQAAAALADAGNHLVIDDVMLDPCEAEDWRRVLRRHTLHFVGLHAPLAELEARERARGDREPGLARGQFGRVHRGQSYGLEIDTSDSTPQESAARICRAFGLAMRDETG
jgi:chloramphenicol 3-O phosphotransferase